MSTTFVSSFSTSLLQVWNDWYLRGMVLSSLLLQIILAFLGKRRKYTIYPFTKIILWFAYLCADWIALAALGKLSKSEANSPVTVVIRSFWAPLLILHLGGPDTITAYAFEDNRLWTRHLLILIVKAVLVIYVVLTSWTSSWLSFLNILLIVAGITKYAERILCLEWTNSQKTEKYISVSNGTTFPQLDDVLGKLAKSSRNNINVLGGYLTFTVMRPDINDYLAHDLTCAKIRIETYLRGTSGKDHIGSYVKEVLNWCFKPREDALSNLFTMVAVELGFIFDVVYTKSALIYTKTGVFLRFVSFICTLLVLVLFVVGIVNDINLPFSRIDVFITAVLLGGALAREFYATWLILSSDWAIVVAAFQRNELIRRMFMATLEMFPCLLHPRKMWSELMGQFDLFKYSWRYKKTNANKSCLDILLPAPLLEMWNKYKSTEYVKVTDILMRGDNLRAILGDFFKDDSFKASRGERALRNWSDRSGDIEWSVELDFDCSIILWHLATSVCYYEEDQSRIIDDEDVKMSKCISDYVMYLLAMHPSLILPEHSKSFWLDLAYEKLKTFVSGADMKAASALFLNPDVEQEELKFSEINTDNLHKFVSKLAMQLRKAGDEKWKRIKEVWIEMLFYAAHSSNHVSHVKQLGEGIELISFFWILGGYRIMFNLLPDQFTELVSAPGDKTKTLVPSGLA